MKLKDRFQADNSTAEFCREINIDAQDAQPGPLDDQMRYVRCEDADDELVKYMSSLPSYLKAGDNIREKAFSVGVIDWRRLEKWQRNHKPSTWQRTGRSSTSTTSTSSSHSAEASSTLSSRGRSCSPINRTMPRPTLLPHLIDSTRKVAAKTAKSTGENAFMIEQSKSAIDHHFHIEKDGSDQAAIPCAGNNTESEKTEINAQMLVKTKTSTEVKGHAVKSYVEEKTARQSKQSDVRDHAELSNRVIILLPRNVPGSGNFDLPQAQLPFSATSPGKKLPAGQSQGSNSAKPEVLRAKFNSKFAHTRCSISKDASQKQLPSDMSRPATAPTRTPVMPCRSKYVHMNVSSTDKIADKSCEGLESTARKASEKGRSTSPFRRFSIGVGKLVKSSNSEEAPNCSELTSLHASSKSCVENLESSATTAARSRSSPLRRLLDPLLKSKVSSSNSSDDPSKKTTASMARACRSSKGHPDSSVMLAAKANSDSINHQSTNVDNSHMGKISGLSQVQALLRVAFKNGLPLFTFAVENDGDILAATMKECGSSSGKEDQSWVYTFLTVREVKKKTGSWINQGGKSKGQSYVPNVVAQMMVSESQLSNSRESVLFSVEPRKQNQPTSDFKPNDELAAIVSQIPLSFCVGNEHQGVVSDGMDAEDLVNTKVILPGGVHSLPSKGGPSSLIQRWRSGGCCDCGGWDLGCQLTVLSGDHHLGKKLTSLEPASAAYHFSLFPQIEDMQENLPEYSLAAFKDGIYSIEFKSSSFSSLQAFAVCISVLESRKLICNSKPNISAGKSSGEAMAMGGSPAKYVSYPPVSPVGRV